MELPSLLSIDRFQVFSGVGMQSNIGRQPPWNLVAKAEYQVYMRPEGPWQRLAAALRAMAGFSKLTLSDPGRARAVIVGYPLLLPYIP